ncbi:nitrilase [Scheffersomyces coipomensis]|uniref:nitrilase n=1 Tax=Scheffersomyces coipomensis TaxID=1788519 RepID=UPI00315DD7FF
MTTVIVAALQIGADPRGTKYTLEKILSYEEELKLKQVKLVVIPEATLGGYPKGSTFGTYLGYRLPEGRQQFAKYYKESIELDDNSPELSALVGLSSRTDCSIVIGVIERGGSTLYCTIVYIDPNLGFIGKHRKLMPTATERLIWGQGDGSTLYVADFKSLGKVGGAICWENYMPLLRASFYAKGIQIYVAPTVDDRDGWTSLIRTIGNEGRLFAISAVQFLAKAEEIGFDVPGYDPNKNIIDGGSVIVNPYGEIIAGPLRGSEGLLSAEIDLNTIIEARYDFDPVGHYSRNDVFQLTVDETAKSSVVFKK